MVQPDWAFVFKGGVTAIPIRHGGLCFPKAGAGGESGVCFAMALRRTFLLWNKFLGSFEWPQTYLLYHANDSPARTYCTRAFGRVAHTSWHFAPWVDDSHSGRVARPLLVS